MRILLISDTHGALGSIDRLARQERCEAVFHAGDFGFYSDESVERLEARELFLRVVHSELSDAQKAHAKKLKGSKLAQYIRAHAPLSELPAYLAGQRSFEVPVYAVWGNHEDRVVVEDLIAGRASAGNLHLLHAQAVHRVGPFEVFGLGGNVLRDRLGDPADGLAGEGGKIWTTLAEIGRLAETLDRPRSPGTLRVLLTHVSPGKEPLVGLLAAHLGATLAVSGHMGSPYAMVWNEFAIRDEAQARAWLAQACGGPRPGLPPAQQRLVDRALALLASVPPDEADARGRLSPPWYRGVFYVNLPDAVDGHAVLTWDGARAGLETRSRGVSPPG